MLDRVNYRRAGLAILGVVALILVARCPFGSPWTWYTVEYPDGIRFSGNAWYRDGPINSANWSRLDFSQNPPDEAKSFECKWIISTPDRSFHPEDFEYEAFEAAGGKVPVSKYTSKEDNHSTVREKPLEGSLMIEGSGYQIWCGYESDRRLRYVRAIVDYRTLPKRYKGLSITIDGRSVQLPCSVHRLEQRLGEPRWLKKG